MQVFAILFFVVSLHSSFACDKYLSTPMREYYQGENLRSFRAVPYVKEKNHEYFYRFENGKIMNPKNQLAHSINGIFTMSPDGKLYIKRYYPYSHLLFILGFWNWHHSSFLNGAEASSMGYLKIRQGNIVEYNNLSGHYFPDIKMNLQLLVEILTQKGSLPEKITFMIRQYTDTGLNNHRYFLELKLKETPHHEAQVWLEYYSKVDESVKRSYFHFDLGKIQESVKLEYYHAEAIEEEALTLERELLNILKDHNYSVR